MRRAKKVAVPEEEEEEEMDFDMDDMDELEGAMDGMTLEDLLSPEEIAVLEQLVIAVVANDVEEAKKIIASTYPDAAFGGDWELPDVHWKPQFALQEAPQGSTLHILLLPCVSTFLLPMRWNHPYLNSSLLFDLF
jgi:hypothetical protein